MQEKDRERDGRVEDKVSSRKYSYIVASLLKNILSLFYKNYFTIYIAFIKNHHTEFKIDMRKSIIQKGQKVIFKKKTLI